MKYLYCLLIISTLLIVSCEKKTKDFNECFNNSDTSYLETGSMSFDEITNLAKDDEYIAFAMEYVNLYKEFLSDKSDVNQGEEPLKQFICRFISDKDFQNERIKVDDTTKAAIDDFGMANFKFMFDQENGTLYGWSKLDKNEAIYLCGWIASEYALCATFNRINEKWFLVNYITY